MAGALKSFGGNKDLAIASWTLGVGGTNKLFKGGGIKAVRGAFLDVKHPKYGTVGDYIDFVNRF